MMHRSLLALMPIVMFALAAQPASAATAPNANLVANSTLEQRDAKGSPTGFVTTGGVEFRYLGDPNRDAASNGFALQSTKASGAVACDVSGLDQKSGKWFRFTVRGLPQSNFAVKNDELFLKVAFFGDHGKVSYDAKAKKIYPIIEQARKDLAANGVRGQRGAEVWQTYTLDFCLPFPQVDQVQLIVGFEQGAGGRNDSEFFVDDFSLIRIPEPPAANAGAKSAPPAIVPAGDLLPLGGRWFYAAKPGEKTAPKSFDAANADRLLYHDDVYSAPFAGNTTAWMRSGNMLLDGTTLKEDRYIADNVTIRFDKDAIVIHTRGIPNHPTGQFPEQGFGNPNRVEEQDSTYYFPLAPRENPTRVVTTENNSNHALHMGPIGLAINGVVFFNPFDAGNQVAVDMMDRCCGHPNQDGQYHYHKYPICVNTPWSDEGKGHSPLLGFAFDGYPLYGPYEREGVMAKDIRGDGALNEFNVHYDPARGWHYHVTPGKFPFLIGGFWGVEDTRNVHRPNGRGPGGQGGGPNGGGPSSGRNGGNDAGPGSGGPSGDQGGPGAGQGGPSGAGPNGPGSGPNNGGRRGRPPGPPPDGGPPGGRPPEGPDEGMPRPPRR
jgi:hypothetical protein